MEISYLEAKVLPALQTAPVVIDTPEKLEWFEDSVLCTTRDSQVWGIDCETSGIDPKVDAPGAGHGRIECWSLSNDTQRFFLWSWALGRLKNWLEAKDFLVVGHNIYGFDYHMFANHGIELGGIVADTMYMSRLLYCSKKRSHRLKQLAKHWLGYNQPEYKSLFMRPKHTIEHVQETKKKKGEIIELDYRETVRKVGEQTRVPTLFASGSRGKIYKDLEFIPLSEIPRDYPGRLEALYDYASADAAITLNLYYAFRNRLEKEPWTITK